MRKRSHVLTGKLGTLRTTILTPAVKFQFQWKMESSKTNLTISNLESRGGASFAPPFGLSGKLREALPTVPSFVFVSCRLPWHAGWSV